MFKFENLNVYKDAVSYISEVYNLTRKFPKTEDYGLTSQLRRASVSIALNIAEGVTRSKKEFAHFLDISRGSCHECFALLDIAYKVGKISEDEKTHYGQKLEILARQLSGLKRLLGVSTNTPLRTTNSI